MTTTISRRSRVKHVTRYRNIVIAGIGIQYRVVGDGSRHYTHVPRIKAIFRVIGDCIKKGGYVRVWTVLNRSNTLLNANIYWKD